MSLPVCARPPPWAVWPGRAEFGPARSVRGPWRLDVQTGVPSERREASPTPPTSQTRGVPLRAPTPFSSPARPSICRQRSGCVVRIRTAADRAAANAGGRRLSEIPSLILWDTYPKRDCRLTPQFRLAFLEAPPICLRGGCTIWHSRQRCARLPASPRPGQDRLCPYLFRD